MSKTSVNNKRIVKNTLALYFRMMLVIVVTLYTSRVVLQTLGVEDYGIYNVVGGGVVMLGFLNNSLSGAGARFITFALGKDNKEEVRKTFSTVLFIHILLAILMLVFAETLGLWFVYNKLVIPVERITAALWVYHSSILSAVVSILSVPYNSLIIAHERMSAFAYISIIEVVLKLFVIILLMYLPVDKLAVYAVLVLLVQIFIRFVYNSYCIRHFDESKEKPRYNSIQFKRMVLYAGWTLNGNVAVIGYTQGLNILLNLFFGPAVNAARGIAVQVDSTVKQFVAGFQTAVNPQIIKSYASEDFIQMHQLIIALSKYGTYLVLLIVFPLFICINPILQFWLGDVPEHTENFVRIMLLIAVIEPLRGAMVSGIHATGDIKRFQLWEGSVLLSVVPVAYVLLKIYHITPEAVFFVFFFIAFLTQCVRMFIVLPKIRMGRIFYIRKALIPLILPILCAAIPAYYFILPSNTSFVMLCVYIFLAVLYMGFIICSVGIDTDERNKLYKIVTKIQSKHELL